MTDAEKIKQIIDEAEELIRQHTNYSKPEFNVWHSKVERFLTRKFGQQSVELKNFRKRPFSSMVISRTPHDNSIECVRDLETTILEFKEYLTEEEENSDGGVIAKNDSAMAFPNKVFIIHGHDGELKEALARLIESQGIEAVILSEQANQGKTIIEKFEEHSDVGAAIGLFTKDDIGRAQLSETEMPRARQNVVFEAGYFIGKLGRDRVVIVAEKDVELPSDLQGVVYIEKDDWKIEVCRELKAMNYEIDFNRLF